jgi:hypothetical protein
MKIRVDNQLVTLAKEVFKIRPSIRTNELLTGTQLRALERKGFVEKLPVVGSRKYVDVNAVRSYIWRPTSKLKD